MYTCKVPCFFRNRLHAIGDEIGGKIEESESKMIEKYFTAEKPVEKKKAKEPKTLKDVQESKGGVFE